jgi:hypothetical protein
MLKSLRFVPLFIKAEEIIFGRASFYLSINKKKSNEVSLFKSILQIRPLAPILYVLAVETFSYLLYNKVSPGLIKRIPLLELEAR